MRLGRRKQLTLPATPAGRAVTADQRSQFAHSWSQSVSNQSEKFWVMVRNLPLVKDWRILSDSLFLLISFGLGLFWFITIVVLGALGGGLSIIGIGIPILAALFALVIWGAQFERQRLHVFLGVTIPSPYRFFPASGAPWKRAWGLLKNPQLWRDMAYMVLLFPMGIIGLMVVFYPVQFLLAPVIYIFGGNFEIFLWDINHFFEALFALIIGAILFVPFTMLINLTATLHGTIGKRLLAPSTEEVLTERVEELTESRSAVMRAMHLERRRIERDLHDGAQQRLVSIAMELGLAREKMKTDPDAAMKLLEASHEDSKLVLAELRDLVRGIHPAVLTDRGLDAAISAIAGRSPIPVEVEVNFKERLPEEVEGSAYFVVVESLTNVSKHSGASRARVTIDKRGGWLRLEISDNGIGGATLEGGSGIRGLRDRILALEGRFSISSPPGKGTTIKVDIPAS